MGFSSEEKFVTYYVLEPPENCGDLPTGHPNWDPDLHCPKYRVISAEMQKEAKKEEKRSYKEFVDDEPIYEPQKKALGMIPTLDLIPPNGFWFDSDKDAEAFITAVARVSDVSVDIVNRKITGRRLYQFLNKVSMLRGEREETKKGAPDVSLQERRDRHWRAVIKEAPLARDFTPELVSHVTLMLVCASRALSDDKKGLNRSTDLSNKLEKLQIWFEANDKAALDEFDALHPYRDPNHPNHRNESISSAPESSNDKVECKNKNKNKNKGKARSQGRGGFCRRKGRLLPPGVSTRRKGPNKDHQRQSLRQSQPLPHPHPERRTDLSKRSREGRRYHPY